MTAPAGEATVRYTRTPDGVNLAYIDEGAGPPVVLLPFHFNHVRSRWIGAIGWGNTLVANHRVVSYDSRGQGLSTRLPERPLAIDGYNEDLETILRETGVERPVLAAYGGFAHVALRYAIEHPQRVSALALICASESFAAWPVLSMTTLARENWDLFIDLTDGRIADERWRGRLTAFFKACAGPEEFLQLVDAFKDSNVSDLLGSVRVPTIVIHTLDQHWVDPEEGRRFAAKIPGAEMILVDGETEPNPVLGVRAIEKFLAEHGLLDLGRPSPPTSLALTERQNEILHLIAQGKTNREVAQSLFLSERTVERHLGEIYIRLGARNRGEAISFALRHG